MSPPTLEHCTPLNTPLRRRLQTVAVAWHCSSFVVFTLFNLMLWASPLGWLLAIPYLIYFFRDKSPANGAVVRRYSPWFRSWRIWTWYCHYFPISLHRSVPLEPTFTQDSNSNEPTGPRYIFGYHPHGIGALGAFGAIGTDGCGWSRLFPGVPVSLMTLVNQFHIPLYRDYLLALGITSVSRKNALRVLHYNQSICIVVGGARESLLTQPIDKAHRRIEIILHKRKGFIKLALETGNVALVPTFAFGETDTYSILRTEEGSWLHAVQMWLKTNIGFTIPVFYARGLFNYDFGLLPYRKPIAVVTGRPVHIPERVHAPPDDVVNHYHQRYIDELKRVYYDNRQNYGYGDVEIDIVG